MPTVGDSFPEEKRREFLQSHLKPGQIFYLFCNFTDPPKNKYLVLVCVNPQLLFFVINSKISHFILSRTELYQCQVPLQRDEYNCLDHDSFIDCSTVKESHLNEIEDQVLEDISRIKGIIRPEVMRKVGESIKGSRILTRRLKKRILNAWSFT